MTIALSAPPALPLTYPEMGISKRLEALRLSKKALRLIQRVKGPLSLRRLSGLSQPAFAEVLAHYVGQVYQRATVCLWEQAERRKGHVPRAYWRKHYAPAKAIAAMHRLIADLVAWASAGRYRASVTGKRVWRVKLVAVKTACPPLRGVTL
jgi:hypothetical protein